MFWRSNPLSRLLSALVMLSAYSLGYAVPNTEALHYQALYQGAFTAGKKIPIANIRLETKPVEMQSRYGQLFETRMSVSSAVYAMVEKSFPFRVVFRSLYLVDPIRSLALEKYQKTRKLKHEVTWMDLGSDRVMRYRKGLLSFPGKYLPFVVENWLASSQGFGFYKFARHRLESNLVDHLAMLQSLRSRALSQGGVFHFPVTNGKNLYKYRVVVEKSEQINLRGAVVDAWKLRFDGYRIKKGVGKTDYRSIYVWFEKKADRRPLRFENRNPLGQFTIEFTGDGVSKLPTPDLG